MKIEDQKMVDDERSLIGTTELFFESFCAMQIKHPKATTGWPIIGKFLHIHWQELTSTGRRFSQPSK
jgi:hypothetical protein